MGTNVPEVKEEMKNLLTDNEGQDKVSIITILYSHFNMFQVSNTTTKEMFDLISIRKTGWPFLGRLCGGAPKLKAKVVAKTPKEILAMLDSDTVESDSSDEQPQPKQVKLSLTAPAVAALPGVSRAQAPPFSQAHGGRPALQHSTR